MFTVATSEIDARWDEVAKVLSPAVLKTPDILDFHADFGVHAHRAGIEEGTLFWFNGYRLQLAMPIHEHLLTVDSTCSVNEREYMISFDFDVPAFEKVLAGLPEADRALVRDALKRNPFQADLEAQIEIDCTAILCAPIQGPYEIFAPFRIVDVSASRYDPTAIRTPHPGGRPSDMPEYIFRLSRRR